MNDRIFKPVLGLLTLLSATSFQATGCNALTGDELVAAVNQATQGFLNDIFAQWIDKRIDGFLNVE